uniref:Galactosyltransferase C-terminal domain-containing protein n=1 Tax=viral metagenome TaxID=1070528 RepID=A0A6C0AYF6_9ZZZZ|tara:strand:+ start:7271 stop:8017 length:747 start_codon:yes stop_codon:yes gene_type:complete
MSIPTKIFIVPYRNREAQKNHFDIYMKYILEDLPKEDYKIFFVHQCDNKPFNRGAIKNIGFLAMKKMYPSHYQNITFIFNDIDTIPYKKNLLNYDTTVGSVKHFYGFKFALGGIFSIKGLDFEKTGGFPNYWGWGLEDNLMQKRVLDANIQINRSQFFNICDHNIIHINDSLTKLSSKEDIWRYKSDSDNYNDIKNLNYIIENEFIHVNNFNTNIDPNDNHFYKQKSSKMIPDKKFNPKYGYKRWTMY